MYQTVLTLYLQGPPMQRHPAAFASTNGNSVSSYLSDTRRRDFHLPLQQDEIVRNVRDKS